MTRTPDIRWLDANANGFAGNMRTLGKNEGMLHWSRCMHLYPPELGKVHMQALIIRAELYRRMPALRLTCTERRRAAVDTLPG
jgi:hypothetical protein